MAEGFRFPEARLLLFARAPRPGESKRRLIPALGREGAARLHAAMLDHMVASLASARLAPVELWCHPDGSHPRFRHLSLVHGVTLAAQRGENLGERMTAAFETALRSARFALLCGTDCPALEAPVVAAALDRLREGDDAVLVPAEDGGYVAIGLRRPAPWLFEAMPWGESSVAQETRKRLQGARWRWSEPECLWDVDDAGALPRLRTAYPAIWNSAGVPPPRG
ncbi:MAG: TIGR04282 family arsenosugar biosynthesis glycosyltransferase [Gammaproteobacteria bacterium]